MRLGVQLDEHSSEVRFSLPISPSGEKLMERYLDERPSELLAVKFFVICLNDSSSSNNAESSRSMCEVRWCL